MKTARKPTYSFLILLIALIIITTLLARFAVLAFPFSNMPGVSALYIAVAFMIIFTLWFGGYGAIAAYAGTFIGAGVLVGIPATVNWYWSLAGLWQVLIPLVAFRLLSADVALGKRRDMVIFVIFGLIINNAFGALWGTVMLALGNQIAWADVTPAFFAWFIGNIVITALIAPLVLRRGTPHVKKTKVFVRNYWD
jgi:hypothetical protein